MRHTGRGNSMITVYDFSIEKDRGEYYRKMTFFSEAIEPSLCSFDEETGEWLEEEHVAQNTLPKDIQRLYDNIRMSLSGETGCIPARYEGRYGLMFHSKLKPAEKGQVIGAGTFNLAISLKQHFTHPVIVLYNYTDEDVEEGEIMSDVEMFLDFEYTKAGDFKAADRFFREFESAQNPQDDIRQDARVSDESNREETTCNSNKVKREGEELAYDTGSGNPLAAYSD